MKKLTIQDFFEKKKNKEKIVMISTYDFISAKICEEAGIDTLLVGDSLGMVFKGEENTLNVTLEEMIYHAKAVRKGAPNTFLIVDMPFLSYQVSKEKALENAGKIIKETRADAVKIEGTKELFETVLKLTTNGIPVVGHIGFTPQYIANFGKFKVIGKTEKEIISLKEDIKAFEEAGAFMIVLESIKESTSREIIKESSLITIGIGAGKDLDGQVLVFHDIVGLVDFIKPKFVKRYFDGYKVFVEAIKTFKEEVKKEIFPSHENLY